MTQVHLIASPDDYLLELELDAVVAAVRESYGDVEPEIIGAETTPEELAVELCSPSLFAPQRVLVAPEIEAWVDVPAQRQPRIAARPATVDATAVAQVLGDGLAEGIALVLGACCDAKPKGVLAAAVETTGQLHWQPVPAAPKPWEDVVLTREQEQLLGTLLQRTAADIAFTPEARGLLFERLGFAPRSLVQEARKLAAASLDGTVDEDLVRSLCFPREHSLEVVSDGLLGRRAALILDLLAAAQANAQVRDWQGGVVDTNAVPRIVYSQAVTIFQQLLYLRRVAAKAGLGDEMAPQRTSGEYWYPRQFKQGIGPALVSLLEADAPSPVIRQGSKSPTVFRLGGLFKGAGRYSDHELVDGLAASGEVERALRGDLPFEAVSVWIANVLKQS